MCAVLEDDWANEGKAGRKGPELEGNLGSVTAQLSADPLSDMHSCVLGLWYPQRQRRDRGKAYS